MAANPKSSWLRLLKGATAIVFIRHHAACRLRINNHSHSHWLAQAAAINRRVSACHFYLILELVLDWGSWLVLLETWRVVLEWRILLLSMHAWVVQFGKAERLMIITCTGHIVNFGLILWLLLLLFLFTATIQIPQQCARACLIRLIRVILDAGLLFEFFAGALVIAACWASSEAGSVALDGLS